jgi:hypothetical protein
VLYTLCTGRPPFRADSALAVLRRVSDDTPRPIRQVNADIPEWLEAVVAKLHCKKPDGRYACATDVAQLLERHLARVQQPGSTTSDLDAGTRKPAPAARRFLVLAVCASVLLAAGALVAQLLRGDNQGNEGSHARGAASGNLVTGVPGKQDHARALPPGPRATVPAFKEGWPDRAVLVPDSQTAIFSNSVYNCVVWDLRTNQPLRQFTPHGVYVHIWGLAVSADGQQALSGDDKGKIYLWKVQTGQLVRPFAGHTGGILGCAFVPGNQQFVSLSNDGNVRVWDMVSGESKVTLNVPVKEKDFNFSFTFSTDASRLLLGQRDGSLQLVDVLAGKELRLWKGHDTAVTSVALSRDGGYALSGDQDGMIRLWDLKTEQEVAALAGHTRGVYAVAFTPDGRRALSGSEDKTVRLWDLAKREEVECFQGHTGTIFRVEVSSDGRYALSMTDSKQELAIQWRLPDDPR